jgi:Spy/CpxP family protein refolding chaperone
MKTKLVIIPLLCCCLTLTAAPRAQAQSGQRVQQLEQLAQQLQLTPEQKTQLIPILRAEAPKVRAIKADTSLSKIQKLEQLKAVHDETDPQVRSILTPEQYQKLQEIRRSELQQAVKKRQN